MRPDFKTLFFAALLAAFGPSAPAWGQGAPAGLEAFQMSLPCGQGQMELYAVRLEPAKLALRPHHESEFPGRPPAGLAGWAQRLPGALALINAGQYYPDRSYMGLLRREGEDLSPVAHKAWQGFLVGRPKATAPAGAPAAAIIDLETHGDVWGPDDYDDVAQSFMLFDRRGHVRVKKSERLAARAAIGQDGEGRFLLLMTPMAVAIYDFAVALQEAPLGLVSALGLDGGLEAQLWVRSQSQGGPVTGGVAVSLPAVIAVEPAP